MLAGYDDIRSRIPEEPKWFDCHGTPRYCEMDPRAVPSIYAQEVAFLEIACSMCGRRFNVEVDQDNMSRLLNPKLASLQRQIQEGWTCYGDPPRHGGCIGETTLSHIQRVLAYWSRSSMADWVKELEKEENV